MGSCGKCMEMHSFEEITVCITIVKAMLIPALIMPAVMYISSDS